MYLLQRLVNNKISMLGIVFFIIAILILAFQQSVYADKQKVKTVYHVYEDNQLLGILSEDEKRELDSYLLKSMKQASERFPEYELKLSEDYSFVPEHVFSNGEENNPKLYKQLTEEIQIEAKSYALEVGGVKVAHLPSAKAVDNVLKQFKLQYVTQEELDLYEQKLKSDKLDVDQEMIPGIQMIKLSEDINIVESQISPNEILDEASALTLINQGTLNVEDYSVKEGDVLGSIAANHGLTTEELLSINEQLTADSLLKIGQNINVTVTKPLIELMVVRKTVEKKSIPFNVKTEKTDSLEKGQSKILQQGANGEKEVHSVVTEMNGTKASTEIISEQILSNPIEEIKLEGTKDVSIGTGSLAWPTVGGYVSSKLGTRWGKLHKGIDIARPSNKTIKAADNGRVESAGYDSSGYGNKVVINHGNGMKTVYAHLSSISVETGQVIGKGSAIGVMGSTGNSTGVHLHFEIYVNGKLMDPLEYL